MKKIAILGLCFILAGLIMIRREDLITLFHIYFSPNIETVSINNKNEYYRDYDFLFVKNTDNFTPSNFQDVLNIYYTVINAGKSSFTFYCPPAYEDCINDINQLANDQSLLSDINNYTHPFNGFSHIETQYDTLGKVTITIVHSYTDEQIRLINQQVDFLSQTLISSNASIEDNIRNVHDYIINHTQYDSLRSDEGVLDYQSDIAYGPLFEGYAVCGGYTDLMELFLERIGVKSFKVSSEDHIWNAVQIGDRWYHLDLTWDDPVADDGNDYLEHNYFLIDTNTLLTLEQARHNFNRDVYLEFQNQ